MRKSFRPKKSLGQHFLHDLKVLAQIVHFIAPQFSDSLVEIGPGTGTLTTKLLPLVNSMEVIEIDRLIIPKLKQQCKNRENLHIYIADVLSMDFAQLGAPLRLVGNLPYNISTPLLFKTIENIDLIQDLHFMVQKEVAERIAALPGTKNYGRLSVMLQYYYTIELLCYVGPRAFFPPPKVSSAFIRLVPRKYHAVQDKKLFKEIVQTTFGQRRKMLANSLKKLAPITQLVKIGIDPTLRPEQLTVDDFILLSNKLSSQTRLTIT